jgi:hypothetical protein
MLLAPETSLFMTATQLLVGNDLTSIIAQGSDANSPALVTLAGHSFHEAEVANYRHKSVGEMGRSP